MLPRSCLGNSLKPHFDRQAPSVHLISIQTPCDHPSDSDRSNLPRSLYCILGSMASAPSPESVLGGYFVAIIFAILSVITRIFDHTEAKPICVDFTGSALLKHTFSG